MEDTSLVVVGNGFDIYHGIPSSYSDFREFVKCRNARLFDSVSEYLPVDDNWSNFEQALGELDAENIATEYEMYLPSYGADDWSDSGHHDYQYELQELTDKFTIILKREFYHWITSLEIPSSSSIGEKALNLNAGCSYFTFNYTETLVKTYNIPINNILHIHGASAQQEAELVLGHAWKNKEKLDSQRLVGHEGRDTRVVEGVEILNEYFSKTFKGVDSIIYKNESYFSKLNSVTDVYVLGHSLELVDRPYIERIVSSVDISCSWCVTYYGPHEKEHHTRELSKMGIRNFRLVEMVQLAR